jgi:predicted PhzF superfamily epimerase YddE/YHI9
MELTSDDALRRAVPFPMPPTVPKGHLAEWDTGTNLHVSAYVVQQGEDVTKVRTRMFWGAGLEDAATGSAACALSAYLAKRIGGSPGSKRFELLQGVEMGRCSEISVTVDVGGRNEVLGVVLEGAAVKVMEGWLEV